MGKKDKPNKTLPTDAPSKLTHSPFAALGAAPEATPAVAPLTAAAATPVCNTRPSRGRLVLRRETKHRAGNAVIVIRGFGTREDWPDAALDAFASELKRVLGCGGTVERTGPEREIVLQGDHAPRVAQLLAERGFRVGGVTS